jgi:hypothetical protein
MRDLIALSVVLIAGCQCTPSVVTNPLTLDIPAPYRLAVPAELTSAVPDPLGGATVQGDAYTVGDAVNAAELRRIALDQANARLQAIAELHGE